MARQPILALPAQAAMAPVDSDEVAAYIVECVADGQRGEREGFAGPQTMSMIDLMEQFLAARGLHRRIRGAPLPKSLQNAITAGNTSPGARRGTTTWAEWLKNPVATHYVGQDEPCPEACLTRSYCNVLQRRR